MGIFFILKYPETSEVVPDLISVIYIDAASIAAPVLASIIFPENEPVTILKFLLILHLAKQLLKTMQ